MDCYAIEHTAAAKQPILARALIALTQVFAGRAEPSSRLDLDDIPDRVKRDLGFLDGREPHYEDERMR
ncbi:MAG: hypothetical protein KGI75_05635 [Rhizobiaceae bacterium]|nr:hypothetical protein [Rhizobiaceae bacterium]